MKILQWSMTIPKDRQIAFLRWFRTTADQKLTIYGAIKHELYAVSNKSAVGRQTVEEDRYIELIYFPDRFNIAGYFEKVKADINARKLSQMYEKKFGAKGVELRILPYIY